ncbi:hypothetical protein GW17_00027717 [Ensete ventricosum]|nr:hypothetical protein GW17_00027717 [Ensete ventricosum]
MGTVHVNFRTSSGAEIVKISRPVGLCHRSHDGGSVIALPPLPRSPAIRTPATIAGFRRKKKYQAPDPWNQFEVRDHVQLLKVPLHHEDRRPSSSHDVSKAVDAVGELFSSSSSLPGLEPLPSQSPTGVSAKVTVTLSPLQKMAGKVAPVKPGIARSGMLGVRRVGGGEGWNSKSAKGSRRWGRKSRREREEAPGWWGETGGGMVAKKRVLVVIDHSARAKHAMMWALTHVANKGDLLTLLHVVPPDPHHHHHHHHHRGGGGEDDVPNLAKSLGTLCKACKPEVGVHSLMVPSLAVFFLLVDLFLLRSSSDEFVEQCISKADCLTLAVRKQRRGVGGYLISTRWQKNFWLLA